MVGQRDQSHDRIVRRGVIEQQFTDFVKSTYRVFPTRGLRNHIRIPQRGSRSTFLRRTTLITVAPSIP
jgi:hypothetical protein